MIVIKKETSMQSTLHSVVLTEITKLENVILTNQKIFRFNI